MSMPNNALSKYSYWPTKVPDNLISIAANEGDSFFKIIIARIYFPGNLSFNQLNLCEINQT